MQVTRAPIRRWHRRRPSGFRVARRSSRRFFFVSLLLSNPATGSTAAGPSPFRFVSLGVAFFPPFSLLRFFEFFLTEADDLTMTDGRPIDVECEARKHRLRHRLSVQLHFFPQPPPPALPFCFFLFFFYRTTLVGRSSRRRRRRRGNERARCKHKKNQSEKKTKEKKPSTMAVGRRRRRAPTLRPAPSRSFSFFSHFFSFSIYKKKGKRRRVALGVEGRSSSLSRLTGLLPSFSFQPHSFT